MAAYIGSHRNGGNAYACAFRSGSGSTGGPEEYLDGVWLIARGSPLPAAARQRANVVHGVTKAGAELPRLGEEPAAKPGHDVVAVVPGPVRSIAASGTDADMLSHLDFPEQHRTKLHNTNPLVTS